MIVLIRGLFHFLRREAAPGQQRAAGDFDPVIAAAAVPEQIPAREDRQNTLKTGEIQQHREGEAPHVGRVLFAVRLVDGKLRVGPEFFKLVYHSFHHAFFFFGFVRSTAKYSAVPGSTSRIKLRFPSSSAHMIA